MSRSRRTAAAVAVACGLATPATAAPDAAASYWFVKQPEAPGATRTARCKNDAVA
jgi:hypothetical protein